jgi:homoserine dehydrogenase
LDILRIALIGFGNVGQGFVNILKEQGESLAQQFGVRFQIIAVCDLLKGSVCNPDTLNPATLLEAIHKNGNLDSISASYHGWDALRTIQDSNADVIVELTPTNLDTGEPAFTNLRTALEGGKHVVTSNKGPIVLHYHELNALAETHGVQIGFEGTVMSGTPALRLGKDLLIAAGIQSIQGIVNSTTNYILTQMENGMNYANALLAAQTNGYAEADPTADVEGYDAAGKMVILANLLMGASLSMSDVKRMGIPHITPQDIASAHTSGRVWKLVGTVEKSEEKVTASVCPTLLPRTHRLAFITGISNAITYTTNLLGDVTILGPGAGRLETGYAIITDLLSIYRKSNSR